MPHLMRFQEQSGCQRCWEPTRPQHPNNINAQPIRCQCQPLRHIGRKRMPGINYRRNARCPQPILELLARAKTAHSKLASFRPFASIGACERYKQRHAVVVGKANGKPMCLLTTADQKGFHWSRASFTARRCAKCVRPIKVTPQIGCPFTGPRHHSQIGMLRKQPSGPNTSCRCRVPGVSRSNG